MSKVNLTIDGIKVSVEEGSTILEAAKKAGVKIPTLCYLPEIQSIGACRMCLVEIEGSSKLQCACMYPVSEGMVVKTNTPAVHKARKFVLELILSNHPADCLTCIRNGNCELQKLANELGLREIPYSGERPKARVDSSNPCIIRDTEKCILCRRCVSVCHEIQEVGVIFPQKRGFETAIAPPFDLDLEDMPCSFCGQCLAVCPVGALYEKEYIDQVWQAINDPEKFVIVQTAPAIRAAIGEEFGLEVGTRCTGKLAAALRRMGFDKVFDTQFGADLTIVEEANELVYRIKKGGTLPMMTSCCPAWIKFVEHFYPDLLDHLSTCKSPQQMFGAVAKTYYAKKIGIPAEKMFVVSVMPCTAKKFEAERDEMASSGQRDVDAVLTTRELARMIKEAGIDFVNLPSEKFDEPLGISTGAATIFGSTGGVMEAALRSAYEIVTGKSLAEVEFHQVRGWKGIREAQISMDGTVVKVAVAHGLSNARFLLDRIREGSCDYHFIEVMACPGGCIGGGGQPISNDHNIYEVRKKRISALYEEDRAMALRKSHENPAIRKLYEEFLGEPLGEKSHHLLHTHYTRRGVSYQRKNIWV